MNNCIRTIILVFVICSSQVIVAQYSITGLIRDKETQELIADVDIFAEKSGIVVTSSADGSYILEGVAANEVQLTLFREGYNTVYYPISLNGDVTIDFELEELSINLTAIELRAKKKEVFALKRLKDVEGTAVYAGKKTEVIVMDLISGNLANNNSRQIYAQVAGLNIYEGSDGGLQLGIGGRGLDPNRTSNFNTRQNGYDISADVLGYPENYYSPPSEAISEIQIIRGASSLQYGTQFGGLINFKLKEIPSYKPIEIKANQTIGSFGLYNSFNYVGLSKGKFSFNTFYNYKRGDGYRPNSDYNSHYFFASAEYRLSDQTKLKGEYTHFNYLAKQSGGLTDDQFEEDPRQSTRSRNWFDVDWNLYNLRLEHSLGDKGELSLSLFGLDASRSSLGFRGNPNNLNENPILALDERDNRGNYILPRDVILGTFQNYGAEARWLQNYKIGTRKSVLLIGAKYYKSDNTSIQGPGSNDVNADFALQTETYPDYASQSDFRFPNANLSLFSENIFYINDRLSITPGLRLEYINTQSDGVYRQIVFDNAGNPIANNQLTESRTLGRQFALVGIGLNFKKDKNFNLYANLSQNYRSVTFSDIRVVSPTFIVDPDISDEKGFTADIGVRGRIDKSLSYELSLYSILYDDRIGIILDDRANRVRKNIGQAIIGGVESLISVNIDRMISLPESAILNGFINTAFTYSEYTSSLENNVVGNRVEFIPTVNVKTGVQAGYKNLLATFQYSYLSQQYTDVQNSLKAGKGDVRSGIIGEIPSYSIMDFSLSYNIKKIKIEGGVNNLLDASYFTRRATGYPGPGIIPSDGRSGYLTVGFRF